MTYEINVSKNGAHYFATHERSLMTLKDAMQLATHFSTVFPEDEGYKVTLKKYETIGREIEFNA